MCVCFGGWWYVCVCVWGRGAWEGGLKMEEEEEEEMRHMESVVAQ